VQKTAKQILLKLQQRNKRFSALVASFCALAFFLLPTYLFAQKPIVALTIDKKSIAPNERVTVTVTSNIESSMEIAFPKEFAVEYGIVNGMEQKADATGKLHTYYYMQQNGAFKRAGSFSFYAFVNHKGKVYKSNKLTVNVEEREDENEGESRISSGDPVFGILVANKSVIYEGEAFVVASKVFSRLQILKMEGYAPFEPEKNTEEFSLPNSQSAVESTKINGRSALTFEIGKQLLFPLASGKLKITPFEMALRCDAGMFARSFRFRSSSLTVLVKPLPANAPKEFIKAVGAFDVAASVHPTKLKQGDYLTYTLTVSGTGNLHAIKTPDLILPASITLVNTPTKEETITYTEAGATGRVVFTYNLQLTDSGKVSIGQQAIAYFDLAKDAYVTLKTKAFQLDVASDKSFVAPTVANEKKDFPKNSSSIVANTVIKKPTKQTNSLPVLMGIITPITVLSLFYLFFFLRKRKNYGGKPCEECKEQTCKTPEAINYWEQLTADDVDSMKCAILLPKAIVQQVDRLYSCSFGTRDKAFDQLAASHPYAEKRLREIIDSCDHFRYGLGTEALEITELIDESIEILSGIDV
jgi:hypothetical protein